MGILTYATTVSLDGYVADATGDFQWSAPSEQVFAAHLARMREVSTEILGRKTYELMRYWGSEPDGDQWSSDEREFAGQWQNLRTVVVSSTLDPDQLVSERDTLLPTLALGQLREMVAEAPGVVEIFGPTTAAPAIQAGLVEAFEFFIVPKVVGGGLRALPEGVHLDLRRTDHTVFDDGSIRVRYISR